jgi:hypothetical protein
VNACFGSLLASAAPLWFRARKIRRLARRDELRAKRRPTVPTQATQLLKNNRTDPPDTPA